MPQYAAIADLAQVGVSSAVTTAAGISNADLDGTLLKRSVFADGYIGKRFLLPITAWGDDLRLAVAQLAAWDLMTTRVGMNPEAPSSMIWRDRRDEAIRWLEGVAAERIDPVGVVDSTPATIEAGPEVFTSKPRGW